jgi:hypothetical protein
VGEPDRRIRLTEKEAAILLYLHRAAGRAVPRQELLDEVWGYSRAVATHTLETHVYRLRRKIEATRAPRGCCSPRMAATAWSWTRRAETPRERTGTRRGFAVATRTDLAG